jgi:hypothetical protein
MRTIALTFSVFSLAASTSAAEIYKLNKTAKARKELPVTWFFKNLKDNCESGEPPEIDFNIPPKGGTVCLRSGMVPSKKYMDRQESALHRNEGPWRLGHLYSF